MPVPDANSIARGMPCNEANLHHFELLCAALESIRSSNQDPGSWVVPQALRLAAGSAVRTPQAPTMISCTAPYGTALVPDSAAPQSRAGARQVDTLPPQRLPVYRYLRRPPGPGRRGRRRGRPGAKSALEAGEALEAAAAKAESAVEAVVGGGLSVVGAGVSAIRAASSGEAAHVIYELFLGCMAFLVLLLNFVEWLIPDNLSGKLAVLNTMLQVVITQADNAVCALFFVDFLLRRTCTYS